MSHFRASRFEEAIEAFQSALDEDPSSEKILRNLGHALASAGHMKIMSGDLDGAVDYLERAVDHLPDEGGFHYLLAVALFRKSDLYGARMAVEETLALNDSSAPGHELLGDIYYQEGSLTRAIPEWERALEVGSGSSEGLKGKIARAEKEEDMESSFGRDVSVHFTMQYDGPVADELAEEILNQMEESYDRIGDELGNYPEGDIPLILYSQMQFNEISKSPLWAAGSFDGKIRVPVGGLSSSSDVLRLRSILTHELTHAFLRSIAPAGLPLWFEEGLAKYFEGVALTRAEHYLEKLGGSPAATFNELNRGLRGRGSSVHGAYLASFLAVNLLVESEGLWTVRQIVESVGEGIPFREAFLDEARMEVEEFEEKWQSSLP